MEIESTERDSAVLTGWDGAPSPSVLVAADGSVRALNRAARTLFRTLYVGGVLREHATASTVLGGAGPVDGRTFAVSAVDAEDGCTAWWLHETTDLEAAREELRRERERTSFLRTASDALLSSFNAARTMEVAAELAADRLADAAWIVAPAVRGRHAAAVAERGRPSRILDLSIRPEEVPGLAEALQGFPPVPSRWIDPSSIQDWLIPDALGELGALGPVLITALPGHGVPAGALVLLRSASRRPFDADDESLTQLFAARVGAALAAANLFEEQSAITDVLTADLLPPVLERGHAIDFAGIYRPAEETARLGGDFYDVHPLPDGGTLTVLGDVCGHGLEAAVLTGKIRSTIQALLPLADDHDRMLGLLNSSLLNSPTPLFASMVLATATPLPEGVRLGVTRAGHLPPLVVRTDGRVEEVFGKGQLVGVLPEVTFETVSIDLAPGESCLLYTDGIVEAIGGPMGDEFFGEPRLRRTLAECAGLPAEAIVERVQMLAMQWLGHTEHDDMALLAIAAPTAGRAGR